MFKLHNGMTLKAMNNLMERYEIRRKLDSRDRESAIEEQKVIVGR